MDARDEVVSTVALIVSNSGSIDDLPTIQMDSGPNVMSGSCDQSPKRNLQSASRAAQPVGLSEEGVSLGRNQ